MINQSSTRHASRTRNGRAVRITAPTRIAGNVHLVASSVFANTVVQADPGTPETLPQPYPSIGARHAYRATVGASRVANTSMPGWGGLPIDNLDRASAIEASNKAGKPGLRAYMALWGRSI